ncbi:MAG: sulfatase-like hydrolase/transferase [Alphaproteobacteria bacterium]
MTGSPMLGGTSAPNILFIANDQERYFDQLPSNFRLPGKERLLQLGTNFTNQQINSCVCTSSRSNIYTGQHIQQTRMFDNVNYPWSGSLSTDIPTIGHMLRDLGYYTAYQGKFHLNAALEEVDPLAPPELIGRELLDTYGFSDYTGIGDIIGHTLGGYLNDEWIAAFSKSWLRSRGMTLNEAGQPWFLAVNLVNPHDVMMFNTDRPGEPVQSVGLPEGRITHAPRYGLYEQEWDLPLPESRNQSWDGDNHPPTHLDFQTARAGLVGQFPNEGDRWDRLQNYYLNCIQDCDRHILSVLDELEATGMMDNTIIVRTSDHGELAGAHGMHGKGTNAYREQNHVPLHIVHPDVGGGQSCAALTSHLDLVPTLISMAGGDDVKKSELLQPLKGHDLSGLLSSPGTADVNDVHDATLFNYNMFSYLDPDFTLGAMALVAELGPVEGVKETNRIGLKPDLANKRGAIRTVFDGRYKFSRYFAPLQHNTPKTMEQLTAVNDLELFDHTNDPGETVNLAADVETNSELVMTMNTKLNTIIEDEAGIDDGSFLGLETVTEFGFSKVDI